MLYKFLIIKATNWQLANELLIKGSTETTRQPSSKSTADIYC